MKAAFPSTATVILALAGGVAGCTGDDTSVAPAPDASRDTGGGTPDATVDSAEGESSPSSDVAVEQLTAVRVANWSPGAPGVDLCLAPQGTTAFQGPLLAGVVASLLDAGALGDGGAGGIPFPSVGAYFDIVPGQYDARIVASGSPDCSVGIGADSTGLPALQAGGFATLAVVGEANPTGGAPALRVVAFHDDGPDALPPPDTSTPPLAARFVNAAAGEAEVTASVATSGAATFTLLAPFGGTGKYGAGEAGANGPPINADGYVSWQVSSAVTVTCGVPNQPGVVLAGGTLNNPGGAILTLVLVGAASASPVTDAAGGSFQLIECQDNSATAGLLSNCSFVPSPLAP